MQPDPTVNRVDGIYLCDLCLDGAGGECHVPGCFMFLSAAPDIPKREYIICCGGTITPLTPAPSLTELAAAIKEEK